MLCPLAGRTVAAAVTLTLLAGCGGGHASEPSTGGAQAQSSTSRPATTAATSVTPAARPRADAYWPYQKLVASLSGRTLALPRGRVRLDGALLECSGDGARLRNGGMTGWQRYTCTQTLFQGGVDHDITFDVGILNAQQMRIVSVRSGAE